MTNTGQQPRSSEDLPIVILPKRFRYRLLQRIGLVKRLVRKPPPEKTPSEKEKCPTCSPTGAYRFLRDEGVPAVLVEQLVGLEQLHRDGAIDDAEYERRITQIRRRVEILTRGKSDDPSPRMR